MFVTLALVALTSVYLYSKKRYRWFYILYKTLNRDIRAGIRFARLNFKLWRYERTNKTVPKVFRSLVKKHPKKTAFYFEDEQWTFEQMDEFSNRVAHFFKREGYKRGDTVALLFESRPEYVCVWLGLAKIGVVTALINTNLVSDPLAHSLKVSNARGLIFGSSFTKVVKDVLGRVPEMKLYQLRDKSQKSLEQDFGTDLRNELENEESGAPTSDIEKGKPRDKLLFIYTSGTTGLPKAAVITNMRFMFMALGLNYMISLREDDILYDPLPLYHSAGGMVGAGQCLLRGVSVAIRKKFSASNFWSDCAKYKCTAAQYIGEICRYILAVHVNDVKPVEHSVRTIFGNGLRPQIWEKFVGQFRIKEIYEFYGATEGNSNLVNIDNKVGAVGFVPWFAWNIYPVTLIRCDEITGEPIRNEDGFCMRCEPGEPGVFIGVINPKKTVNDFSGYADKSATQRKLIENVFKTGDLYFNSGDILIKDELGYYYFKDRTGDTFRWKGENVATSEVEAVISNVVDFRDAVVYGVEIPGTEGRAGMVAIVDTTDTLDLEKLSKGVKDHLPSYSIPIFLRVMRSVPLTGTFKLKKIDLQKDGFDMDKIKDKLYIFDAKKAMYTELTLEVYDQIMSHKMRL